MLTHYLGDEEVNGYLRDFAARLKLLGDAAPTVWVPIGPSGRELVKALVGIDKDLDEKFFPVPAEFDRATGIVEMEEGSASFLKDKNVLVIDSSIHSGHTIRAVVDKAVSLGAAGVCSYTLVLKKGASFVPSYWAVSIGDYDRAYFLLERLPNNHFHDSMPAFGQVRERPPKSKHKNRDPYFHLRKLSKTDIQRPAMPCGVESLDRTTWADRFYDMSNHSGRFTYLLESGQTTYGYVTFEFTGDGSLSIEAVAVRRDQRDKGYGAALIRWAETSARQADCRRITMWGITDQVEKYERLGYRRDPNREPMRLDGGEEYSFMSKPVLYHL
jgi:GNAT superfamily N-acetyltransferase